MLRGYRLAIIALGLTLFAFQVHSQETEEPTLEGEPVAEEGQSESTSAGEEIATPEEAGSFSLVPAIQDVEAAVRDLVATQDQAKDPAEIQREKDDLNAQVSMAHWAKWMFFAAVASLLLTAAGVVLIWRTLLHTRAAAEHAGGAVTEAKTANKIADRAVTENIESMRRAERAYVFIGGAGFSQNEDGSFLLKLRIGNRGKTPAVITKIHHEWAAIEPAGTVAFYNDTHTKTVSRAIGSGDEWKAIETTLRKERPYFFGYINFIDIFGKHRTSRFCDLAVDIGKTSFRFETVGTPVYNEWD